MTALKLTALDEDDLAIVSAHMQDAILAVGDLKYLKGQEKLALVANRFDWESVPANGRGAARRRRTGLQIARVKAVRSHRIRRDAPDAVLSLLAIRFLPGKQGPEGEIELTFAGGGALRLDVECIEVALKDLGEEWETHSVPRHEAAADD
ncbi:MAG: DUF2948 family protein [Hyphomicrobiales bacterium]